MEFAIIKINSVLWHSLWNELGKHPINNNIEIPLLAYNNGYCWEYIGSFLKDKKLISEFLHKQHPKTNKPNKITLSRELLNLDDIEKIMKIKF